MSGSSGSPSPRERPSPSGARLAGVESARWAKWGKRAIELRALPLTWEAATARLNEESGETFTVSSVRLYVSRMQQGGRTVTPPAPVPAIADSGEGLTRTIESPPSGRITSLEDLLTFAKVDREVWEVERFVVNTWENAAKLPDGSVRVTPIHQVKAWLRRRIAKELLRDIAQGMLADLRAEAEAQRTSAPRVRYKAPGDVLFELSPFDAHLNKLAWAPETGHDHYDSGIASARWVDGCTVLLERAAPWRPAQNVLVLGNDFFNVAGANNATVGGTPQDVDSRLPKMFRLGVALARQTIDRALELAPTKVVFVRGNHDGQLVWLLGEVIQAWYRSHPHVTFDNEPTARKYLRWGTNLLGFTHGDKEKADKLPLIMATERRSDWAETTHREWHLGHLHKAMKWDDEHAGVRVRRLPSLCSPDNWHSEQGYVGTTKATEAYLFSQADGYIGHLSHTVRAA